MATTLESSLDQIGSATTASLVTVPSWIPSEYLWTLIYGFVIAFVLAFAVGANDVANSFGTTVGSKVLSLKTACILASIFETLGAIFLGAKVGETIRKGIIDVTVYNETESGTQLLMFGEVSAMTGAAVWQLIATFLGLPVSGTHSIVGACIGFSVVAVGSAGVNWSKLGFVIASWFISPVLAGVMTISLYIFVKRVILEKEQPMINGLRCLPFFYAFAIGVNCLSISYIGVPLLGLDAHLWVMLLANILLMVVVAIVVQLIVVPRLRRKAIKEMSVEDFKPSKTVMAWDNGPTQRFNNNDNQSNTIFCTVGHQTPNDTRQNEDDLDDNRSDESCKVDTSFINGPEHGNMSKMIAQESSDFSLRTPSLDTCSYDGDLDSTVDVTMLEKQKRMDERAADDDQKDNGPEDPASVRLIFSSLQILTACFGSFAHGGNDVSNAIGPLIALWLIYHSGEVAQSAPTPWYLLMYGGLGIVAGLCILGRRVIKTIGNDLTKITPSRGFCIELMTALTVLLASNIGIPVSTTHCKVGSVVSIGWFRSRSAVTWSTVRNIAVAWFVTVPISGLISAGVMYILLLTAG